MPIFWLMLITTGLFAFLFELVCEAKSVRSADPQSYKTIRALLLISLSTVIFFASMRSVVSDTMAYTRMFAAIPTTMDQFFGYVRSQSKDPVFWAASMLFKCLISDNYHVWFFAITAICTYLLTSTIAKYSQMPFLSIVLFLLTCNFTWLFNGMRQFLAACIVFYAYRYLIDGNLKKYVVGILVASMVHASAIIALPVYFIVRGEPGNIKMIAAAICSLIFISALAKVLPFLNDVLSDSGYSEVITQFASDDGVNPVRIMIALMPFAIYLIRKGKVDEQVPPFIRTSLNLSLLSSLIYLVGKFTSGIYVGRLPIYFEMINLILYPWLFNQCFGKRDRMFVLLVFLLFYFLYFYYQMVISWDGFGYVSDVLGISLRG